MINLTLNFSMSQKPAIYTELCGLFLSNVIVRISFYQMSIFDLDDGQITYMHISR